MMPVTDDRRAHRIGNARVNGKHWPEPYFGSGPGGLGLLREVGEAEGISDGKGSSAADDELVPLELVQ